MKAPKYWTDFSQIRFFPEFLMIFHVQIYGNIRILFLDQSSFYAKHWILGLILMDSAINITGAKWQWSCGCLHRRHNSLSNYTNWKITGLKNYSYSAAVISCSLFEGEHGTSWNSALQRENPGSHRLSLTFPLQQSEQVALRHLLNEVPLVPFICVKDKITRILA